MTYLQSIKKFSKGDSLFFLTENLLAHVSPFENVQFNLFLLQHVNKWLPNFSSHLLFRPSSHFQLHKKEHVHFYSLPLNTTSNFSSKTTIPTMPKSNTFQLAVRTGELWKAIVIRYQRISDITSKSSDFTTASSYASIRCLGYAPWVKSICHSLYTKNKFVFTSFDLETSGERCGIIQMRTQIFRIQDNEAEVKVNVFSQYVIPGRDAVWNKPACTAFHGVSRGHE